MKNAILIDSPWVSWLSRVLTVLIVLAALVVAALAGLQFYYQQQAERYFASLDWQNIADGALEEEQLIIHSLQSTKEGEPSWLTATGRHKQTYQPLLAKELGRYQSHEYLGWHTSYDQWLDHRSVLLTLLYQVNYEKGVSEERFYFSGLMPVALKARVVQVD